MGSFFVVWSSVNIVVERIKLDDSFGNSIRRKLRRKLVVFHHKYFSDENSEGTITNPVVCRH